MSDVFVITGGAGGMGLATAHRLAAEKDVALVLADMDQDSLQRAQEKLKTQEVVVKTVVCDITIPSQVDHVMEVAAKLGQLKGLVHTAGVSPSMGQFGKILAINVLGTIYVDQAFIKKADTNFTIVNVASMAAYMLPKVLMPKRYYASADFNPQRLLQKLIKYVGLFPKKSRADLAYPVSKNFVKWYTQNIAKTVGAKDSHIISVSPGSFDTAMGRLEKDSGAGSVLKFAAIDRFGKPDEVADLLYYLVYKSPVYLTGTDILIDGGVVGQITLKDMLGMQK